MNDEFDISIPKSMEDKTIDFLMGLFNDRQRLQIDSMGCFYLGFAVACVSKNKDKKEEK